MDGRTAATPHCPASPRGRGAGGGVGGVSRAVLRGGRMGHGKRCRREPWVVRDGGGRGVRWGYRGYWGSWGYRGSWAYWGSWGGIEGPGGVGAARVRGAESLWRSDSARWSGGAGDVRTSLPSGRAERVPGTVWYRGGWGGGAGTPGRWHYESAAVTASSETRSSVKVTALRAAPRRGDGARGLRRCVAALRGGRARRPRDPRAGPPPSRGLRDGRCGRRVVPSGMGSVWGAVRRGGMRGRARCLRCVCAGPAAI